MEKFKQIKGVKILIEARESHKKRVNIMLHVIANNKNLSVSLFKAYEPLIKEWFSEIKLNIEIVDSSCKVLNSKESCQKQNEIEESTYSMSVTPEMQDMVSALEKVNISSTPTDDKIEKFLQP